MSDLDTGNGNSNEESGWINEIGFSKSDEKQLEEQEKKIYNTFTKKIKIWAYFVFILSGYVLLNVCIEYSSAPYYEASVACLEIFTPECEKLGGKTTRLYLSETLYGIMMIT